MKKSIHKTCTKQGCDRKNFSRGLCQRHYYYFRKNNVLRKYEHHGMHGTKTYTIWRGIIRRCKDKKFVEYHRYGGRGITIDPNWEKSFLSFLEDMGLCPGDGYEIDRIDNDGDYTKENCQWLIGIENRRKTTMCKLNYNAADEIRDLYKNTKFSSRYIGKLYGVSKGVVLSVIHNRSWVRR